LSANINLSAASIDKFYASLAIKRSYYPQSFQKRSSQPTS